MPQAEMESYLNRLERGFFLVRRQLVPSPEELRSLTGPQFFLLKLLQGVGGSLTASDLAAHLGVTTSAMTGMVDRLVRPGLVQRVRDSEDRRVVWVHLTEQGRAAVTAAQTRRRERMREVFGRLGEAELKALVLALEDAVEALSDVGGAEHGSAVPSPDGDSRVAG